MDRGKAIDTLPTFDLTEHLNSDEAIVAYLNAVIEQGDASELAHALGVIAKARGMTEVAHKAGISREALYKALRPGASPRFETIQSVCRSLGIRLGVSVDDRALEVNDGAVGDR